jgi:hypothetical protein
MKSFFRFFTIMTFGLLIVIACTKENDDESVSEAQDMVNQNRTNDVWLCHKPDGGNPHSIWVDASAVDTHLDHGDELLDADGDGYTTDNTCGEGNMDDCDDNDATVNPGAEEICGDGIDNDCDSEIDEDCFPDLNCVYGLELLPGNYTPGFASYCVSSSNCDESFFDYSEIVIDYFDGTEFYFLYLMVYDMRNVDPACSWCSSYPDYTYHLFYWPLQNYPVTEFEFCYDLDICTNEITEAEYNDLVQWMASFGLPNNCGGSTPEGGGDDILRQLPDLPEGLDFEMLRPKLRQN